MLCLMTTARLDDQLCFALYAASRRLTTAYRGTLTELGITYPQYLALMGLWGVGRPDRVTIVLPKAGCCGRATSCREPTTRRRCA